MKWENQKKLQNYKILKHQSYEIKKLEQLKCYENINFRIYIIKATKLPNYKMMKSWIHKTNVSWNFKIKQL